MKPHLNSNLHPPPNNGNKPEKLKLWDIKDMNKEELLTYLKNNKIPFTGYSSKNNQIKEEFGSKMPPYYLPPHGEFGDKVSYNGKNYIIAYERNYAMGKNLNKAVIIIPESSFNKDEIDEFRYKFEEYMKKLLGKNKYLR